MKKVLCLLWVFLFIFLSMNAQKGTLQAVSLKAPDSKVLYPFDGYFLNLQTLEQVTPRVLPANNYKTLSKYHARFSWPHWWEINPQTLQIEGVECALTDGNGIRIGTHEIKSPLTEESAYRASDFLVPAPGGVVWVKTIGGPKGYHIRKFDKEGKELWEVYLGNSEGLAPSAYHPENQNFYLATEGFLVFTCHYDDKKGTTLIDLENGSKSAFGFNIEGVIRGMEENKIDGFIQFDEEKGSFKANFLSYDWTVKMGKNEWANSGETLLTEDLLIMASYHNISTGSHLAAYNRHDGKLIWKAEVDQLNADHSKYFNQVTLSRFKNKVIMEGKEAYGSYLQVFDLDTGKRLYSSLSKEP